MRYFIHLAYNGNAYCGWQRQANSSKSIQQVLEDTLTNVTKTNIKIIGCGRTDAGVHAAQYFAHFDVGECFPYDVCQRLNHHLPSDIVVYDVIPVDDKAHARYDALSRTYQYFVHLEQSPFLDPFSAYYDINIDVDLIQQGFKLIAPMKEFRHLCLAPDRVNNTICTISEAKLDVSHDAKILCFTVTANRFLKSMIRLIVARLLLLGSQKISFQTFEDVINGHQKLTYAAIAYPQGLHLTRVSYPYLYVQPRWSFNPIIENNIFSSSKI